MAGLSAFCISSEYSSWIQLLVDNSQTTSFSSSSGACWSVCFLYLKCWALNWDLTHTFKSWFTSTACFLDLFYFDYSIIGWLYLKKKNWQLLCPRCFVVFWKVTRDNGASLTQVQHQWDWEMSLSISEAYITTCSG